MPRSQSLKTWEIEASPQELEQYRALKARRDRLRVERKVERPPLLPHQIPPGGDWTLWLLEGGRGCGKTEACARFFDAHMVANPGHRGRIIAPTFGDAVEACIEGPSGLLAVNPDARWHPAMPGGSKVVWPNGSEAIVVGTHSPSDVERLRALGNRHIDWWEEMAANPQLKNAWDQAQLGLRMGARRVSVASTTPRGSKAYRQLREAPGVALTHASIFDNPHNPPGWVELMRARYEGTRLGQQELQGLLLDDVEGALWSREMLEARVEYPPELVRVVVAIDPAVTSGEGSDDTGIVIAGVGANQHGYVLADRTCHLSPDQWAKRAVAAFGEFNADRVVAETNNGGDMVATVLKVQDGKLPFKKLTATRGKRTRAEPVAALYEQGKVHHVGTFPDLEDQLCGWVPGEGDSPDRLDALVWALTELMLGGGPAKISVPEGEIPRPDRGREQTRGRPVSQGPLRVPEWQRRLTERAR